MKGEATVGPHRVGHTQGLLRRLLKADMFVLGVALDTPLLGITDQQMEQVLLDTPRPKMREALEHDWAARRELRGAASGEEPQEERPTCGRISPG